MTPDTKVKIEFILDPEVDKIPQEFNEFTGSFTFYFPFCQVYSELDKDIRVIQMPKDSRVIDLMKRTDMIKITGSWYNDTDDEYDGRTSFERLLDLRFIEKYLPVVGLFTWVNKAKTITATVISRLLNADVEPGQGDEITYNFEFLILDRTVQSSRTDAVSSVLSQIDTSSLTWDNKSSLYPHLLESDIELGFAFGPEET